MPKKPVPQKPEMPGKPEKGPETPGKPEKGPEAPGKPGKPGREIIGPAVDPQAPDVHQPEVPRPPPEKPEIPAPQPGRPEPPGPIITGASCLPPG